MLFELLRTIKPLKMYSMLYNSYEHSLHLVSIVSQYTNENYIIYASLLHEVPEKLGESSIKTCYALLSHNQNITSVTSASMRLVTVRRIAFLVEELRRPSNKTIYQHAYDILSTSNNKYVELIVLCKILSIVQLSQSPTVRKNYNRIVLRLIKKNIIYKQDPIVENILSLTNANVKNHFTT